MIDIVKNIRGTGNLTCYCGSWLKHWENFSHQKADKCAAEHCSNKAEHGGYVIKYLSGDNKHYIIPLCPECNNIEEAYRVETALVSANVSETCGKN